MPPVSPVSPVIAPGMNYWYSRALAPRYVAPGSQPTPVSPTPAEWVNSGGPSPGERDNVDRGHWNSVGEWMNDPGVRRDTTALVEMASPMIGGINAVAGNPMGRNDGVVGSPGMPSQSGLSTAKGESLAGSFQDIQDQATAQAQADLNAQAAEAQAAAAAEAQAAEAAAMGNAAAGETDAQALAKGGTVKGDKKYGQDDVLIAADGDEEVIRARRAKELGSDFRREVQKKKLDRKALIAALRR